MNMQKMMQELQKMQKKMSKIQGEMESALFEAEAGGGMVKITINGKYEVQGIKLAKEAVDPEDVEALEDLLLAAFNSARAKVDEASQEKMGGLGLPKGMGIPGM